MADGGTTYADMHVLGKVMVAELPLLSPPSNPDPLDFVKVDLVAGAVIELGRLWRFVKRDGLGLFDRAAFFEIGRDAGGAESMAADRAGEAGGDGPALDHVDGVVAADEPVGEPFAAAISRAEEGDLGITGDAIIRALVGMAPSRAAALVA
jgi:hypothetical protein